MIRVVTLDCRRGRRVRAEAQLLLGTRGGSKGDQLPATAEPPLRVGSPPAPARRGSSSVTLVPGQAAAARRCRGPRRKRAESCRAAQTGPRFPLGAAPASHGHPLMAAGPSLLALSSLPSRVCSSRARRRTPASRHSPLTLLAAAFWRLPFGGDVPQPTSGERRPADHPRPGAHREGHAPLCGVLTQRLRPV